MLSTQVNAKLLEKLKSDFKREIKKKKYQSEVATQVQKQYLVYFTKPSFQRVNKLFVLSYGNNSYQTSYKRYCLLTVEIKRYDVMIYGRNVFDQPVKNDLRTYDNIRKI